MDCPVTARPTVIVISDSLGDTACEVVLAASGQFDEGAFCVLRLPKVTSVEQVKSFVGPRVDADHRDIAVFRMTGFDQRFLVDRIFNAISKLLYQNKDRKSVV